MKIIALLSYPNLNADNLFQKLNLSCDLEFNYRPIGITFGRAEELEEDERLSEKFDVYLLDSSVNSELITEALDGICKDQALVLHRGDLSRNVRFYFSRQARKYPASRVIYRYENSDKGATFDLLHAIASCQELSTYQFLLENYLQIFQKQATRDFISDAQRNENIWMEYYCEFIYGYNEPPYILRQILDRYPNLPTLLREVYNSRNDVLWHRDALLKLDRLFASENW